MPGEPYPPLTLPALFQASVAAAPTAPLIDFLGRRFSYARVAAEAGAFAAGLQARGIGRGDRVALYLPNVPLYLSAYYGTLLAGASVVNFAPMWDAAQLARAIAQTTPRVLVTIDVARMAGAAGAALQHHGVATVVVAPIAAMLPPGQRLLYGFRGRRATIPGAVALAEFLGADEPEPVTIDPLRDVAVIQYTSGATGHPRAVRLSHQNLTANARQLEAVDPWHGKRDVMIGILPLAGIFGNSAVLNRTVLDRGCIALLPRFEPRQILRTIARTRATTMPGIPTMFQALLDDPALKRTDLGSLRACISGGASLAEPLKARFEAVSGANLVEGYGLAEASGVVSVKPLAEPGSTGGVGKPLPGTRWTLLDPDDAARPVAPGAVGELAVAGPQVMLGYWNDPAGDAAAFAGEWLRTGDFATLDGAGVATIVDRREDVMQVAGQRVFPSRIEAVLLTHPAVREAVVIGVRVAFRGESPNAFVTLRGETLDTGESLRNWLNGRLPAAERVLAVEVRESLPRVAVGKLDRRALRAEQAARLAEFS
ncbi:MAG: AMP-binding protein [Novosphingobium sp.]|nr:AMP-binding protein [Novosphingobium sp.]